MRANNSKPAINDDDIQNYIKYIGYRIYYARKNKGVSVSELAEHMGVKETLVILFEIGERQMKLNQLLICCELLDINLQSLFVPRVKEPSPEKYEKLLLEMIKKMSGNQKRTLITYATAIHVTGGG